LLGKVLKQMQRRPEIDLSHVDVSVEHGVVHLAGSVRSQLERNVMGVAARAIEGVRKVEDRTSVVPLWAAAALTWARQ
jgi:osmotically-inducible protein OsmY